GLPAGEVDRLEARLHHLDGLIARERSERRHEGLRLHEVPEPLGARLGERVVDLDGPSKLDHVLRRVVALLALAALAPPLVAAVAASSIKLLMATAPTPRSQLSRYWSATLTFKRRPASVTAPPGTRRSRSSFAVTCTSGRCLSIWLAFLPSFLSKISFATGT